MSMSSAAASAFDRPLITGKAVAVGLGISPTWFYQHRDEFRRRGFPEPIFHTLYNSRAVHAWMDAQMNPLLRQLLTAKARAA